VSRRPLTFLRHPQAHPSRNPCRPMCCPNITLLAEHEAELTCESEDLCFVLPVRARRAWPENAFHRLVNLQAFAPAGRVQENGLKSCIRAPFRLLPIRAPRQTELRTSSWLAPSNTNRSCDLSVQKTRDASERFLPPNRTACTRASCVPGSLSPLSRRGRPTES
jgi:hypothetical protein